MRVKVQSVLLFQWRDLYLHVLNEVILLVHWEVKIQDKPPFNARRCTCTSIIYG